LKEDLVMTNSHSTRLSRARIFAAALAALSLAAPAAWAQKSAEKAAEDRESFRKSVLTIRSQIDSSLGALDGIVKGKDPNAKKKALKKYTSEIDAMEKQIEKTKDYAKDMQERKEAYFKDWEKRMESVDSAELKASATERRALLQDQYKSLEA